MHQAERFQLLEPFEVHFAEHAVRRRPLHGQSRDILGLVSDRHVEADRRCLQPCEVALLRAQAIFPFAQVEDRSIVDDLAVVVTPDRVGNASRTNLRHVARDQSVEVVQRVGSRNAVLGHRRQVEHACRIANRKVFGIGTVKLVRTRIALPLVPLVDGVETLEARIKRRLQAPLMYWLMLHAAFSRLRIVRAAFLPAAPLTPPPGCAPAPQRNRPSIGNAYCAAPLTGRTNRN